MSYQISSSQYFTSKQQIRNKYVRISLLDFNFFTVDVLEGYALNGNITINAKSDIRRSGNLSFVVVNSTFNIQSGGKIWLDKYVKIEIGIENIQTKDIVWNNLGIFLINQPTYDYDASTNTMSFQCVDLMAKMTGLRNGYILGLSSEGYVLIPEGSNVRVAIIDIVKKCGFNSYYVSDCVNVDGVIQNVPYDMQFDQGTTWYDILSDLNEILPNYQIYFDINGIFRYEKIPSGENDPIMITEDLWNDNLLKEVINVNFNDVKNVVEVWGKVHDTEYFSDSTTTTISGNIIYPTWSELVSLGDYVITALSLPSNINNTNGIYINFLGQSLLIKDFSENKITFLPKNEYLCFSYDPNGYWLYLGGQQAYAIFKDENPESPFYIGSTIGEIPIILSGQDYDNITSNDLALQRAKYEIYKRCRLNDTIDLTTIPVYWADVNWKVTYTPLGGDKISKEYMIQSINIPLNSEGSQSWNLSRFYPFYPVI